MEAQVNGINIAYADHGAPDQQPVLLLIHAFPLSGAMWQPQVAALAPTCRLIVPDLRGFGASAVPAGPYAMQTFANDLVALLDHLGLQHVVVAGVSMGGYIALALLRHHAARVRALLLADTRATADSEEARLGRATNAQVVETHGPGAIANKMLPSLLTPAAPEELRTFVRSTIERTQPTGIAGALRGMGLRPDSTDLLPKIAVPTLLLVGQEDSLTQPAEMATLRDAIPGSTLIEIAGAAHLPNLEQPAAFNAAVQDFLNRV